jgi:hypothetical protein
MKGKLIRILPWIALLSGVLVIILLALAIIFKPVRNFENVLNKKIALDKIKQIRIDSKEAFDNKTFFDYFEKALECPTISTKWFISGDGKIIYAKGVMSASTRLNASIYDLADNQNRGLIDAVESEIDTLQRKILYVAAAIRREGEHNDIYGHLVMPLKTSTNELAGFIGVSYDLDDSKLPVQSYVIGIALVVCFLIYWLALPLWVYYDCRRNNEKYVLWTIFVFIGNLPAYIAYLINRK